MRANPIERAHARDNVFFFSPHSCALLLRAGEMYLERVLVSAEIRVPKNVRDANALSTQIPSFAARSIRFKESINLYSAAIVSTS